MPNVIGTLFHKEIPYGGVKGDKGDTGATPNVSATASVDSSTGTPDVTVVKTGTAENPSFEFAFSNLKGEKGDPGSGSSVDWGDIDGTLSDQTDLSTELAKKYDENDTAETDIQDTDYVPFYDTSATGKRKSLWSNIKAKLKAYFDTIYTLLTIVGTVESGTTASKRYGIGDHFIKDGYFCTAITVITQGATLTLNTNYTQGDVAEAIDTINILEYIPEQQIANDDLDNYKSGGIYRWGNNSIISQIAHRPTNVGYSFFLVVMPHNRDYVIQKIFIDNLVYSRRYYAFGTPQWSHWFVFTGTDTGS